jgi:hypothetical protein
VFSVAGDFPSKSTMKFSPLPDLSNQQTTQYKRKYTSRITLKNVFFWGKYGDLLPEGRTVAIIYCGALFQGAASSAQ